MESPSADYAVKARADILRLLYHQSFPAVFVSMANAALLSMILAEHLDSMLVMGWLGMVLAVSTLRLNLYLQYRRVENESMSFLVWERPYFLALVISSLAWGLGCLWMMSRADFLHQVIIYCFLIGMAGGAISVYSAERTLTLKIVSALVVPGTIWLLLQGNLVSVNMGIGGAIFFMSAIRATGILEEALHRSFSLNHQLLEAKQRAEMLAQTDSLTGLRNRGSFNTLAASQAKFCQRHGLPVALILLDVDHFKKLNDSLGHSSGDLALQQLANILTQATRSSDICARIGGEEFAIFLPNADLPDARITAERIRSTVECAPLRSGSGDFRITVSLGIATGNLAVDDLLGMADKAMYQAKERGRNQVCEYDTPVDKVHA